MVKSDISLVSGKEEYASQRNTNNSSSDVGDQDVVGCYQMCCETVQQSTLSQREETNLHKFVTFLI